MLDRLIAASLPLVPRPIVYRIARRYVAGVTREDALATARRLAGSGLRSTCALLGEHLHQRSAVDATVEEYLGLLEGLERGGVEGGISVKPTHVGLLIDPELCRASLERLVVEAGRRGRFVRIDMEDSGTTDATLALHRELHARHHNVGVVLQAYLKRTPADAEALPQRSSVRLCKGIYAEPPRLTVGGYDQVRASFLATLERLLAADHWVAVATHDEWLLRQALERIERSGRGGERWEIQMLHGVAPQLRARVAAEGHRIRVYVPYGPDWYDYSLRRLRENPRVAMHVLRALVGRS